MNLNFPLYMSPEDSGGGSDADDVDAAMGEANEEAEDDSESEDSESEDTEESESESEEESDTTEEDEEEVDEDGKKKKEKEEAVEDEEVTVSDSPIRSATKKYPKLFKEFPELRESYFRDRDFRQVFPTVDDARAAYDATEQYSFIQNEVQSGNPSSIVDFLAKDTKTLTRFGRAFLKGTMQSNQEAFEHITKPVLIGVLSNAMREAEMHGNKNLAASVKWISQFAFNRPDLPGDEFKDDEKPVTQDNKLIRQQLGEFTSEVFESGQSEVLDLIANSVATIKTNNAVKKTLIREIFKEVDEKIAKDQPHMRMMDSLWNKVRKGAINRQNRATIVSAYVGAFKKLLPSTRAKVLKENGIVVKPNSKKEAIRTTDKETRESRNNTPAGNKTPSARDKYKGKTDLEILNMFSK